MALTILRTAAAKGSGNLPRTAPPYASGPGRDRSTSAGTAQCVTVSLNRSSGESIPFSDRVRDPAMHGSRSAGMRPQRIQRIRSIYGGSANECRHSGRRSGPDRLGVGPVDAESFADQECLGDLPALPARVVPALSGASGSIWSDVAPGPCRRGSRGYCHPASDSVPARSDNPAADTARSLGNRAGRKGARTGPTDRNGPTRRDWNNRTRTVRACSRCRASGSGCRPRWRRRRAAIRAGSRSAAVGSAGSRRDGVAAPVSEWEIAVDPESQPAIDIGERQIVRSRPGDPRR